MGLTYPCVCVLEPIDPEFDGALLASMSPVNWITCTWGCSGAPFVNLLALLCRGFRLISSYMFHYWIDGMSTVLSSGQLIIIRYPSVRGPERTPKTSAKDSRSPHRSRLGSPNGIGSRRIARDFHFECPTCIYGYGSQGAIGFREI